MSFKEYYNIYTASLWYTDVLLGNELQYISCTCRTQITHCQKCTCDG